MKHLILPIASSPYEGAHQGASIITVPPVGLTAGERFAAACRREAAARREATLLWLSSIMRAAAGVRDIVPDMPEILDRYRDEITAMLARRGMDEHTPRGIIFISEERWRELEPLNVAILLSAADREEARAKWVVDPQRGDPFGWSPTTERPIAVIMFLV